MALPYTTDGGITDQTCSNLGIQHLPPRRTNWECPFSESHPDDVYNVGYHGMSHGYHSVMTHLQGLW